MMKIYSFFLYQKLRLLLSIFGVIGLCLSLPSYASDDSDPKLDELLAQAKAAESKDNESGELRIYAQIIAQAPKGGYYHYRALQERISINRLIKNKAAQVIHDYSEIINTPKFDSGKKMGALFQRGSFYTLNKRYSAALNDFNELCKDKEADTEYKYLGMMHMVKIYIDQKKYDLAIETCNAILDSKDAPKFQKTLAYNGKAKVLMGQKEWDKALECLNESLQPDMTSAWNFLSAERYLMRSSIFEQLDKTDEVIKDCTEALNLLALNEEIGFYLNPQIEAYQKRIKAYKKKKMDSEAADDQLQLKKVLRIKRTPPRGSYLEWWTC